MPCHDHKAGCSSWPSRSLFIADAEELARFSLMASLDMRLPKGWNLSLGGVSVALIPNIGTPAMRRDIVAFRAHMPPELRMLLEYTANIMY